MFKGSYYIIITRLSCREARCVCRQAECRGCQNPTPAWARQMQSKSQSIVGTVLILWRAIMSLMGLVASACRGTYLPDVGGFMVPGTGQV